MLTKSDFSTNIHSILDLLFNLKHYMISNYFNHLIVLVKSRAIHEHLTTSILSNFRWFLFPIVRKLEVQPFWIGNFNSLTTPIIFKSELNWLIWPLSLRNVYFERNGTLVLILKDQYINAVNPFITPGLGVHFFYFSIVELRFFIRWIIDLNLGPSKRIK
jgi:hypothetical protein